MAGQTENGKILFTSILVALDSSRHSEAALEVAAAIAKALQANMYGLFVQDERWRQLSRLSSSSEVNELTGDIEPLAVNQIEKQIRILEGRIQRRFVQISRKHELSYTWKSVAGNVNDKLLEAAKNADLITIGTGGKTYSGKHRIGSTARTVIEKSNKPVLILQSGLQIAQSVIAVHDGSESSLKGIEFGLSFAEKSKSKLIILEMNTGEESSNTRKGLKDLLQDSPVNVEIHVLNQINSGTFINIVSRQYGGLLVIPENNRFAKMADLEIILYNLSNPILLMR